MLLVTIAIFASGCILPRKRSLPADPYEAAWTLSDQGKQEFRSGDLEAARYDFAQAVKLLPNEPNFHCDLGVTLEAMQRYPEARSELETSAKLSPSIPAPHSDLALLYIHTHDYENAKREARIALKLKPRDATAFNNLGVACLGLHEYKDAEAAFTKAVELLPGKGLYRLYLGAAQYHEGKKAEAFAIWDYVKKNGDPQDQNRAVLDMRDPESS
jgi:Flp pilus assembly protein TadD